MRASRYRARGGEGGREGEESALCQSLHARTGEKMRDESREESGAMNSRYPELGASVRWLVCAARARRGHSHLSTSAVTLLSGTHVEVRKVYTSQRDEF